MELPGAERVDTEGAVGEDARVSTWERRLLVVLAALALVPLSAPYLPLMDLPQHLGVVADLRRYGDDVTVHALYLRNLAPASNVLFQGLTALLARPLGVEGAARLVLAAGVLGWIGALVLLARAVGARPLAVALTVPLLYGNPLASGYINYWLAWPFAFAGWALVLGGGSAVAIGVLALLCFCAHTQVWGFFLITAPLVARRRGRTLVALLPSLAYAAAWAIPAFSSTGSGDWRDPHGDYRWLDFDHWRHALPARAFSITRGEPLASTVELVWLFAVVATFAGRRPNRMVGVGVAAAVASYALPEFAHNQFYIASRMVAPALVLLVVGGLGGAGRVATGAGVVAALLHLGVVTHAWWAVAPEADGLREVVAQAAPHTSMIALTPNRDSAHAANQVFLHAASWHQVENAGWPAFSFAIFESSPLRFRAPDAPGLLHPGEELHPWCTALAGRLPAYDYYLYRASQDRCGVGDALDTFAVRVAAQGRWVLYAGKGRLPAWPKPDECTCR